MRINRHYLELKESYLFSTIAQKVRNYEQANPNKSIIKLGIGDVTMPLCRAVVEEMKKAVEEMGIKETFKGYGPEQGYSFLREKIIASYRKRNILLEMNEVFINDGAKSDLANILDIFHKNNTVLIPDPVYPVYVDTNRMDGRCICYLDGTMENQFLPMPNKEMKGDIIYLCSPNNPTGVVYTKEQLEEWVNYANKVKGIILFDAAYEGFIQDDKLPRSIYEIEGAKTCAIEFCSYSKTAGFTGTRCGYTIVPQALVREGVSINKLWLRRQTTKFNGTSYIIQKGAAALYTEEGERQYKETIRSYMENAKIIRDTFEKIKIPYVGGMHSPYIWFKCVGYENSWEYFDDLLENVQIVGTPGIGFGKNGEGYFRITAFNTKQNTMEAMRRIEKRYE